jgi:hypothetical protein
LRFRLRSGSQKLRAWQRRAGAAPDARAATQIGLFKGVHCACCHVASSMRGWTLPAQGLSASLQELRC